VGLQNRLKIAAVAATAASNMSYPNASPIAASRLPQSRRLRPNTGYVAAHTSLTPPQDCRSRGDCGSLETNAASFSEIRLKIAAVAATAACGTLIQKTARLGRLKIAAVAATAAGEETD